MNNIQLSSDVIIGLNWEEADGIKVALRVVPVNIYGAVDADNLVITDGRTKSYPFPGGKFAKNALLYSEYPRGRMPGADKALIKLQFDGIPSTINKFLFVLTATDSDGRLLPAKKMKRAPAWCATPTTAMDVIGSGGKLGEDDLAQRFGDNTAVVPMEVARSGEDDWAISTIADGHKKYKDILESIGIKVVDEQEEKRKREEQMRKKREQEEREQQKNQARPKKQAEQSSHGTKPSNHGAPVSSGNTINLITGQREKIAADVRHFTVKLEAKGQFMPDISAFLLDGATRPKAVGGDSGLIFYGQTSGANGAVTYDTGTNSLHFDFERMPSNVKQIAVVLSTVDEGLNFGKIASVKATFEAGGIRYAYEPEIQNGSSCTAIDMCDVYFKGGNWRFFSKGNGVRGGLAELCNLYGIEVE